MRNKDTILLEEAYDNINTGHNVPVELEDKHRANIAEKLGGLGHVLESLHVAAKYFEALAHEGIGTDFQQKDHYYNLVNLIKSSATKLDSPRRIEQENERSSEDNPNYGLSHD